MLSIHSPPLRPLAYTLVLLWLTCTLLVSPAAQALSFTQEQWAAEHSEVVSYYNRGEYRQGLALGEPLLRKTQAAFGDSDQTAYTLETLGLLNGEQDLDRQALGYYQQAHEMLARLGRANTGEASTLYFNIASSYHDLGDLKQAEAQFNKALAITRQVYGPKHPETAATMSGLGLLYQDQGSNLKAEATYLEALAILRSHKADLRKQSSILNNLATLSEAAGKIKEAERYYFETLELDKEVLGEQHPSTATTLNNLGNFYFHQQRYARAEEYYQQAYSIRKAMLGEQHPDFGDSVLAMAGLKDRQGLNQQSHDLHKQAVAIYEQAYGSHPLKADAYNSWAVLHQREGSYEEAVRLYGLAASIYTRNGVRDEKAARVQYNMGMAYLADGNLNGAMRHLKQALSRRQGLLPAGHADIKATLKALAKTYRQAGHPDFADEYEKQL